MLVTTLNLFNPLAGIKQESSQMFESTPEQLSCSLGRCPSVLGVVLGPYYYNQFVSLFRFKPFLGP